MYPIPSRKLTLIFTLCFILVSLVAIPRLYSANTEISDPENNPSPSGTAATPDAAASSYVLTDLGALPNGTSSAALAINQLGVITGCSTTIGGATHAFTYYNGTMTDLGVVKGGNSSIGRAINADGVVAGNSTYLVTFTVPNVLGKLAVVFSDNKVTAYGNIANVVIGNSNGTSTLSSIAQGINDAGRVVGTQQILTGANVVTEGGVFNGTGFKPMHDFTNSGQTSNTTAINSQNDMVGSAVPTGTSDLQPRAILVTGSNTVAHNLGLLNGGNFSEARAVNDSDQVAGLASTNGLSGNHAFLYDNGQLTDLGTLGGSTSRADAINGVGDVVGEADTNVETHAFLYSGGPMLDINSLTITGASGYKFSEAFGINDAGQIVGLCFTPSQTTHAFLLTPSTEAGRPIVGTPMVKTTKVKGSSITLDPGIVGGAPLNFQWFKNSAKLAGQTHATLALTNLQTSQSGNYSVVATNLIGNISDNMTLTVDLPVTVGKQPANQALFTGKTAKFTVTPAGTGPFTYQWQISTNGGANWTNVFNNPSGITGATLATLAIANTTQNLTSNQYRCIINNAVSNITSNAVSLTVGSPAKITVPPTSLVEVVGQDATFSATVSGFPAPTFQWFKGKTALNGETNATLTLTSVQATAADTYSVTATNALGTATAKATLKIIVPAAITLQPVSVTVASGKPAKFSITATGTAKLTYQWAVSTDGGTTWTDIAKAATNSYSIPKTSSAQNGQQFRCTVNNAAAAPIVSNVVSLTVNS